MLRKLLILLLLPLISPAFADDEILPPWQERGTFASDAPLVPIEDLMLKCSTVSRDPDVCAYDDPALEKSCEVVGIQKADIYGAGPHIILRTRHSESVPYDKGEEEGAYHCQADEVALFEVPEEGQARLIWSDATEHPHLSISDVQLYSTTEGKSILAMLYCKSGTEDCTQGALIWTGSQWEKLERDKRWDSVYEDLPTGYQRHKSLPINFANMTQEEHLLGPDDAACCPSGRMNFELLLQGNKLSVGSYGFFIPVEETEEMREMRAAE